MKVQNTSNEHTSVSSVENFPTEIWFVIFCYFEAHDLFHAFTNLNNYFDRLLASQYLFYNIQFNKNCYSNLISLVYCSSNEILNRIISLQWIAKPQYGYLPKFLYKNIANLTRLRSLKIEIYSRQIPLICKLLPELHSLKNVSIQSENIQSLLIETVFMLPSLRLCELINSSSMVNIECTLNGRSNIEILHLTNISIVVQSITNSLFDHLPNLKKFELYGSVKTFKSLSFWISNQISMIERIPITKMKCKSNRSTLIFFEQLELVMPIIKYFSLHLYIDKEDSILLEHLIDQWWSFIQQIQRITIFIGISKEINQANDETQKKFINYKNRLLLQGNQLNEYSRIHWTEIERPVYQFLAEIRSEQ